MPHWLQERTRADTEPASNNYRRQEEDRISYDQRLCQLEQQLAGLLQRTKVYNNIQLPLYYVLLYPLRLQLKSRKYLAVSISLIRGHSQSNLHIHTNLSAVCGEHQHNATYHDHRTHTRPVSERANKPHLNTPGMGNVYIVYAVTVCDHPLAAEQVSTPSEDKRHKQRLLMHHAQEHTKTTPTLQVWYNTSYSPNSIIIL